MRSLSAKLVLAFFLASLPGIVLLAILAGRVVAHEFDVYVEAQNRETLVARLTDYYNTKGEWTGVDSTILGSPDGTWPTSRGAFILLDENGGVVFPQGIPSGFNHPPDVQSVEGQSIVVGDRVVGTMIPGPEGFGIRRAPGGFMDRINRNLLLAGVGGAALSLALGIFLVRSLTRTLRELTVATHAVAQGTLAEPVPIRTGDELGALARAFNNMNESLARGRELRQRMTADIAHELRTPLSVILGHAEALSEGVLPPTPETFHIIHDEANHLNRLVEDLRTLSMSEAGELALSLQAQPVSGLLERTAAAYLPQARARGISLIVETSPDLPDVEYDPDRMSQVMGNLLRNALRHTPEGGRIEIAATGRPSGVRILVRNNGPSIEADELEQVFDRFYGGRGKPRRREEGTGLGLAIAKSIVEAHGGRIWAESPPSEGAAFIIDLPIHDPTDPALARVRPS